MWFFTKFFTCRIDFQSKSGIRIIWDICLKGKFQGLTPLSNENTRSEEGSQRGMFILWAPGVSQTGGPEMSHRSRQNTNPTFWLPRPSTTWSPNSLSSSPAACSPVWTCPELKRYHHCPTTESLEFCFISLPGFLQYSLKALQCGPWVDKMKQIP